MKKWTLLLFLVITGLNMQARTVQVETAYTGASSFDQLQANATMALSLNMFAGLEAKLANERAFKHPIYSVAVPLSLELDLVTLSARPFYYFKNKSDNAAYQDSSAYGINTQVQVTLRDDTVNDVYTHAFLGASYAHQKGTVFYDQAENRSYAQAAYTLGISNTLFNAFAFDLIGTAFQYPNGISNVSGLRSILNQQDLANTQTLDIVHELTKFTVGARAARMWVDNGSSLYISYRYAQYHTTHPEHSVMIGNSFLLAKQLSVDLAYNHVRSIHNTNRRDIFYMQVGFSF